MIKFSFFLLTLISASLFMTSCGSDGVDCSDEEALARELEAATSDYFAVFISVSTDPTEANCDLFKDATEEYIEFAESIRDCVPTAERAEYDRDLDDARQALNDIDCG